MKLTYSIDELDKIVLEKIIPNIEGNIVCLEGSMGSGKTTLINSICTNLNSLDKVSSPTFSLINEYKTSHGNLIYHFDFYRVENKEEAMDLGVEEYFYSSNLCLIEWGSKINDLIPKKRHKISLTYIDSKHRELILS